MAKYVKVSKVLLIISLAINIIFGIIIFSEDNQEFNTKEYTDRIDSLELVLSTINSKKDSVREKIDTVYMGLKEAEDDYEEIRDVVINNSTSDDYLFFTEYLKRNRSRLCSINNLKSAEGN